MSDNSITRGAAQGVTDEAVERAKEAVWNTDAPEHQRDYLQYDHIMRAALEAAFSATPPAPAPEESSESSDSDAGEEWKLVPAEPTEAMLREGAARHRDYFSEEGVYPRSKAVWKAMLAAAPSPTPQPPAVKHAFEAEAVGYMRSKDNDGNAFWCGKSRTAYYNAPVYSEAALSTVRASQTSLLKAKTDEIERLEAKIEELELHLYDYEREIH